MSRPLVRIRYHVTVLVDPELRDDPRFHRAQIADTLYNALPCRGVQAERIGCVALTDDAEKAAALQAANVTDEAPLAMYLDPRWNTYP